MGIIVNRVAFPRGLQQEDYRSEIKGDIDFIPVDGKRQICVSIHEPAPEVAGSPDSPESPGSEASPGPPIRQNGDSEQTLAVSAVPPSPGPVQPEAGNDESSYSTSSMSDSDQGAESGERSGEGNSSMSSASSEREIAEFLSRIRRVTAFAPRIPRLTADRLPLSQDVTIIYSHGNCETLADIDFLMFSYANVFRCRVVAVDYEGYGMSDGVPGERQISRDLVKVWEYVVRRFPGTRIVLWGRSIGTVCACHLAMRLSVSPGPRPPTRGSRPGTPGTPPARDNFIGLILQSPLASAFNVLRYLRRRVPFDHFKTYSRIRKVTCPVFIIHGIVDDLVPAWNTYRIVQSVRAHRGARGPPDWGDMEVLLRNGALIPGCELDAASAPGEPAEGKPRERRVRRPTDTYEGAFGNLRYYLIRGASHNDIEQFFPRQMTAGVHGFLSRVIAGYKHSRHGLRYYWKRYKD